MNALHQYIDMETIASVSLSCGMEWYLKGFFVIIDKESFLLGHSPVLPINHRLEPEDSLEESGMDLLELYADFFNGTEEIAERNAAFQTGYVTDEEGKDFDYVGTNEWSS